MGYELDMDLNGAFLETAPSVNQDDKLSTEQLSTSSEGLLQPYSYEEPDDLSCK